MTWARYLAILVMIVGGMAAPVERDILVIDGATIIDGTGGPPISDARVIIEGGRIKAVGRMSEVRRPRGARLLNARGKFLVPGLIDVHVHYRPWQGELFLAHGITTVKDLGNPAEWMSELTRLQASGKLRAPRLLFVGNNLDAPPPEGDHHVGVKGAREIQQAVRLLHEFGATAIKVRHKVDPDLLRQIVESAHALGLPVTGHLARSNAAEAAMAGIDGLEHASGVASAAAQSPGQLKSDSQGIRAYFADLTGFMLMSAPKERELITLLVSKRVKLIPTLGIRRRAILEDITITAMSRADGELARQTGLAYVPEMVRRDWTEAPLDASLRRSFSTEEMREMREGYHRLAAFVAEFRHAGGIVLAGSDNLNSVPGLTLHRELESLVESGLTPMEALLSATRDASIFLGRKDLGTIEPGKRADLVIVRSNPLQDIRHLRTVERVFQDGREIDTSFHSDYALPPARPNLTRPLMLERMLAAHP